MITSRTFEPATPVIPTCCPRLRGCEDKPGASSAIVAITARLLQAIQVAYQGCGIFERWCHCWTWPPLRPLPLPCLKPRVFPRRYLVEYFVRHPYRNNSFAASAMQELANQPPPPPPPAATSTRLCFPARVVWGSFQPSMLIGSTRICAATPNCATCAAPACLCSFLGFGPCARCARKHVATSACHTHGATWSLCMHGR